MHTIENIRNARRAGTVAVAILLAAGSLRAETDLALPNGGFEQGTEGWIGADAPFAAVLPEAAHSGTGGLRITDDSDTQGSNVRSAKVQVTPGTSYAVRFMARCPRKQGVGVYVEFWDEKGEALSTQSRGTICVLTVPGTGNEWKPFTIAIPALDRATHLTVWVHSFNGSVTLADLDDFTVSELTAEEAETVTTTPTAAYSDAAFPIPEPARIEQLAAMLPAQPQGIGHPIDERDAWDPLRQYPSAAGILARAESIANTPPPELPDDLYLEYTRIGNRRNYEIPYAECISRIEYLVVAECIENKGRFLPAIERDMLAMCGHRSWLLPACDPTLTNFNKTHRTVALGSSYRAWMLATALYWLGDRLPEPTRQRVAAEIRERVLDPYLLALRGGSTRGNWWMRGENNWNAVCNAGLVGTALALVPSPRERAEFLAGMELSNPYFINGFTDDGYCSEGVGYWIYGFGRYVMLGITTREATGGKCDIFADPRLAAIARFPLGILIEPDVAPAFADCGVNPRPSPDILALIDQTFADVLPGAVRTPDPLSGSILRTAFHALRDDPETPPVNITRESLGLRNWFGDAGILVSRGDPDGPVAFGAAIKGGHNGEQHNHNDVGSFAVALNGRALLLDPGSEVYTRRTFSSERYQSPVLNSYGHPVPVVAGRLQGTGREARAEILETAFSPESDRLVTELAAAYDVPALESLVRTFEHDRLNRVIRIEDRVRFSEPSAFEGCLVTLDRTHRPTPESLVVYDENRAVRVDVAVEGADWETRIEEIENPGRPTPRRIGVALKQPVREARMTFTIRPSSTDGLPGIYTEPRWEGITPQTERAVTIQAEGFTGEEGDRVEICDKVGADGKAFKLWYRKGHALTYTVEIPRGGRYAVRLKCAHMWQEPVSRTLRVDGVPVEGEPFLFPFTGGWSTTEDNWRTVWLARGGEPLVLELDRGPHALTFDCPTETGLNLDWIQLVPVTEAGR